jgi:hypothetical protein
MKGLEARVAYLEQRRPVPVEARPVPSIEDLYRNLQAISDEHDRRQALPAKAQLALLLDDHSKRLKECQLPDHNSGCLPGLDALRDRMHEIRVADLRARISTKCEERLVPARADNRPSAEVICS